MQDHILSWITFVPLIGMAVILCLPGKATGAIKAISLVATFVPLVLATQVYFGAFDKHAAGYQLVERADWIAGIQAQYFLGIDGLSLPLVWLTTRTPENIVVNLPDVADHELPGWVNR